MADHHGSVRRELSVMKGGLYQLALLLPKCAVAREQPLPGKRTKRLFDLARLVELLRFLDEDLFGKVWMGQLIHVQRPHLVVRDVAELARDGKAEGERIEREPTRKHLTDAGEHEVDVWAGRPYRSRHRFTFAPRPMSAASSFPPLPTRGSGAD